MAAESSRPLARVDRGEPRIQQGCLRSKTGQHAGECFSVCWTSSTRVQSTAAAQKVLRPCAVELLQHSFLHTAEKANAWRAHARGYQTELCRPVATLTRGEQEDRRLRRHVQRLAQYSHFVSSVKPPRRSVARREAKTRAEEGSVTWDTERHRDPPPRWVITTPRGRARSTHSTS